MDLTTQSAGADLMHVGCVDRLIEHLWNNDSVVQPAPHLLARQPRAHDIFRIVDPDDVLVPQSARHADVRVTAGLSGFKPEDLLGQVALQHFVLVELDIDDVPELQVLVGRRIVVIADARDRQGVAAFRQHAQRIDE